MDVSHTESSEKASELRPESVLRLAGITKKLQQKFELFNTRCELQVFPKYDRFSAWMDECNLSFKFPVVPRHTSVEWTDCGRNWQERTQASMLFLGRASSEKNKAVSEKPQLVPDVHHKWHTDTIDEMELGKAQKWDLKFNQTFCDAVVYFGDVPAECIAGLVGHDQTILYKRPFTGRIALHRHIKEHVRASGGLLPDSDLHPKDSSLSEIVLVPSDKHFAEESLKKNCFSVKQKIRK